MYQKTKRKTNLRNSNITVYSLFLCLLFVTSAGFVSNAFCFNPPEQKKTVEDEKSVKNEKILIN